jgi:undecaprenyl-diphosphatase
MSVAGASERTVSPIVAIARRAVLNLALWTGALFHHTRRNVRRLPWRLSRLALGTIAAIGVVALTMALIDSETIGINKRAPLWIFVVFDEVTDFGKSGWFLWPAGLLLLTLAAAASPSLGRMSQLILISLAARVGFVFLAIGLPSLAVTVAKRLIGRARPGRFDSAGPLDFLPFSWRVDYASLPSGHSTTAFAAAVALGALFPRARIFLWGYAIVIALSRVIVGAHFPSDVLAGAIAGALGALLVRWWFAARGLGFSVGTDGLIHVRPGPSLRRIKKVAARLAAQ